MGEDYEVTIKLPDSLKISPLPAQDTRLRTDNTVYMSTQTMSARDTLGNSDLYREQYNVIGDSLVQEGLIKDHEKGRLRFVISSASSSRKRETEVVFRGKSIFLELIRGGGRN